MMEVENDQWIITLVGMNKDYPPTDEAGFLAYTRSLISPELYDAVVLADGKRMGAALSDHGAAPAHLLGAQLALRTGPSTLAVGVEEH
jgi:hypothetical protein